MAAADLADAPGRPLSAGIPRDPGQAGDFIDLCTAPDLAAEVTLQPIRRYGFDAAILFSDILMLPWALGQALRFEEGEGPVLPPIRDAPALAALDPSRVAGAIDPILETVQRLRAALPTETALIGFAGARSRSPATWSRAAAPRTSPASAPWRTREPALFDR